MANQILGRLIRLNVIRTAVHLESTFAILFGIGTFANGAAANATRKGWDWPGSLNQSYASSRIVLFERREPPGVGSGSGIAGFVRLKRLRPIMKHGDRQAGDTSRYRQCHPGLTGT